jgi:hypothetical protein
MPKSYIKGEIQRAGFYDFKILFFKEMFYMKKMCIYEPAMCCPTGLCGVGVNPELIRISTVLNTL